MTETVKDVQAGNGHFISLSFFVVLSWLFFFLPFSSAGPFNIRASQGSLFFCFLSEFVLPCQVLSCSDWVPGFYHDADEPWRQWAPNIRSRDQTSDERKESEVGR
jgi:hypothetical protein